MTTYTCPHCGFKTDHLHIDIEYATRADNKIGARYKIRCDCNYRGPWADTIDQAVAGFNQTEKE